MNMLEQILITTLRDKNTSMIEFRAAAQQLAHILVYKAAQFLPTAPITISTPTGTTTTGAQCPHEIILIPILRSGLALLPAFLEAFTRARVGVVGLKRDEKTAVAHLYYQNLPKITADDYVIVLDPMIATGGSSVDALHIIMQHGANQERTIFVGVISAQPGLQHLKKEFPRVHVITAVDDPKLNKDFFIVPGLGDFGDRFFGTI